MRRIVVMAMVVSSIVAVAPPSSAEVPGLEFTRTDCEGHSDSVARLYTAGLGRDPEIGGFEFWLDEYTAGRFSLPKMASFFASSDEFVQSYGPLDDRGFVQQLYRNVLGREGESGGVDFWTGQLTLGVPRWRVLLRFSESPENIERSGTTTPTLGHYNEGLTAPFACGQVLTPEPPTPTPPPPSNPGDTKNCSDFRTQAEAQAWFDTYFPLYGDIARLDRDNNGIPCESLP